ncbi:hypothetical protein ABHA35_00015 [[Clostridium] symbiosum]|mgnify:CR=1 FL=1|nr:hypothetical protein [[Clostridium] symbiosum]MDB1971489.1 hypothetical protein [[Clostridium] symbiosum]
MPPDRKSKELFIAGIRHTELFMELVLQPVQMATDIIPPVY